jgi:hypothetical protein
LGGAPARFGGLLPAFALPAVHLITLLRRPDYREAQRAGTATGSATKTTGRASRPTHSEA